MDWLEWEGVGVVMGCGLGVVVGLWDMGSQGKWYGGCGAGVSGIGVGGAGEWGGEGWAGAGGVAWCLVVWDRGKQGLVGK